MIDKEYNVRVTSVVSTFKLVAKCRPHTRVPDVVAYLGLLLGQQVVVLATGAAAHGRLARAGLPHAAHHQLDQRRLLRTRGFLHYGCTTTFIHAKVYEDG